MPHRYNYDDNLRSFQFLYIGEKFSAQTLHQVYELVNGPYQEILDAAGVMSSAVFFTAGIIAIRVLPHYHNIFL
jgi:hypothetical protein